MITAQLPTPPPGMHHVVVGSVDETGVKVAAKFRLVDRAAFQWEFEGAGHYDWSGDAGGGLTTILMW
jgi:hypothetical protein